MKSDPEKRRRSSGRVSGLEANQMDRRALYGTEEWEERPAAD